MRLPSRIAPRTGPLEADPESPSRTRPDRWRKYAAQATLLNRDRRGNVVIMAALAMTALIGCAALTVDLGALSHERRALQLSNDTAAMAAVVPILQIQSYLNVPDVTRLTSIVGSALASNGYSNAVVDSVVAGTYCPDPSLAASARFTPGISTCANTIYDGPVPNAVQSTVHVQSPYYFAGALGSSSSQSIVASSVAVGIDEGSFTLGTGMISAATANAPVINGVLGGMLGSAVSLTAANYDGLSNTPIDGLSVLSAMATSPGVNASTIGGLSGASAGLGTPLQSEISALTASGTNNSASTNALAGLQMLLSGVYGQPSVQLGQLLNPIAYANVAPGATLPHGSLSSAVNSFQMASAAIQMANNGASITIPTSNLNLAGLSSLTVTATAGSPATSGFPGDGLGYVGTSASTSQVTMQVGMQISPAPISLFGSTAVSSLSMPTVATLGSGTARLTGVSCGANPSTDATLTVTGTTGGAAIDTTLVTQVTITPLGGSPTTINVSTPVTVQVSPSAATPVTFAQSDIASGTVTRISSSDSLATVNAAMASSLATQANASINAQAAGLILPPGFLSQLNSEITNTLSNTLAPLLDTVVTNVAAALGAEVGYMDVTATGVRCGIPAIAN